MGPKNAIKIINIQNSYLVHTGSIRSIMSTLVLFSPYGPNRSIPFYLVNSIHQSSIQFTWSYSVHLVHIDPILSTSVLFVSYWSIQSIFSTLVLFGLLWSYSVYSIHFCSIWSDSVYSVHIGLLQSYSIHFVHPWFYSVHFCPISPH